MAAETDATAGTLQTVEGAEAVAGRATTAPASETVRFAALVRTVVVEARRLGLMVPGFRSPPRMAGVDRSLRRRPGASPSVAVRLGGRTDAAVAADLVEGIIVANDLSAAAAEQARRRLLAAVPAGERSAA
ncbi:MAG TPA: hypothetical protein VGH94_10445 [Acidimicrobiales bacterium]|jgi:hypothetical protein